MLNKNFTVFTIFLLFLLLLSSCAVNPVTGKNELMLISEADEVRMGKKFYPNAIWGGDFGGGEYRDPALKTYLKGLVMDIHAVSHRPGLPVSFAIQNSSVPNAWAIPGYVVITRGLLTALQSEAEFVFVMGHEMGHVSARHSAASLSKNQATSAGLSLVGIALTATGSDYANTAVQAGEIGTSLLLLKYGRSDELEADRLGVEYMTRLGYKASNAIWAHRNLENAANEYLKASGKGSGGGSLITDILSTHPRSSIRLQQISKLKSIEGSVRGDGTGRAKFIQMTSRIRKADKAYKDYYDRAYRAAKEDNLTEASSIIERGISARRNEPPFHTLKGFLLLDEKKYGLAKSAFDRALSIDAGYQPAIRGRGVSYYFSKNYSSSRGTLKNAIGLYPGDAAAHLYLGLSYYELKMPKDALRYLNPYAAASPKDPLVHYYLGASHEAAGDRNSAYNEYIRQLNVAPDTREGLLAKERASVLKQSTVPGR